jgi:hypothetical protein
MLQNESFPLFRCELAQSSMNPITNFRSTRSLPWILKGRRGIRKEMDRDRLPALGVPQEILA